METRNLFERLEFELLAISTKGTDFENFIEEIRGKTGIQKMDKKCKALKYRYQSFSSVSTKVIFEGASLKQFDYKNQNCIAASYLNIFMTTRRIEVWK